MRVYTRALRVPILIGRIPGGGSIPLGPYTLPQLVGGALTLVVGAATLDSWGPLGTSGNVTLLLLAAIGVTAVLGRIHAGSRNPAVAAIATASTITSPTWGRLAGRPIRARRPTRMTHRLLLDLPIAPAETTTTTFDETTPSTPATVSTARAAPVVTAAAAATAAVGGPAAGGSAAAVRRPAPRAPAPAPRQAGVPLSAVGQLLAAATATPRPATSGARATSAPSYQHTSRSTP